LLNSAKEANEENRLAYQAGWFQSICKWKNE